MAHLAHARDAGRAGFGVSALRKKLTAQIVQTGPVSIAQFMMAALYDPVHGYYSRSPNIGEHGDFVTAPEMSQMFGEIVGAWCAYEWGVIGRPDPLHLIELGPGRGTLMSDVLRAGMAAPGFEDAAQVHFMEVSAALRALQRDAVQPNIAQWHARFDDIAPGPSLILANEFFDCLPIRQFVKQDGQWRERLVGADSGRLAFGLAREAILDLSAFPAGADAHGDGAVAEIAPALGGWTDLLALRLHAHAGRALIIDYASDGFGDTLQAMKAHEKIDPLDDPGDSDLTAHVDFAALARMARAAGLAVHGPIGQGDFLRTLGIEARAAALSKRHPDAADRIARELHRLTSGDEMGALFQVLCLSNPQLPAPAGF